MVTRGEQSFLFFVGHDHRTIPPDHQGSIAVAEKGTQSQGMRGTARGKENTTMLMVSDNLAMHRFEMTSGSAVAFVEYQRLGDQIC